MGADVLGQMRKLAEIDGHMYPEGMERLYVVNAPGLFYMAWKVIKKFLHPLTAQRIVILGKDTKANLEKMSELIDPAEIPTWLGGGNPAPLPGICSDEFERMMQM